MSARMVLSPPSLTSQKAECKYHPAFNSSSLHHLLLYKSKKHTTTFPLVGNEGELVVNTQA